jgi:metal-dependent amidase/aminoacylase/carboxypeptidase family protein
VPIKESTGLPYASDRTGTDRLGQATSIAHACGHDMHVVADGGGQKSYRRTAVLGAVR